MAEVNEFSPKITDYMTPSLGIWMIITTLENNNQSWQSAHRGRIKREVETGAMS